MFFGKSSGGVSWMIVFLGNPGKKYAETRHNVGFMTADLIEKRNKIRISRLRFNGLTAICEIGGKKVLLLKPETYMNLSGNAVAPAASFYKIPPERIIVVCDDLALPMGKLRVRAKGSSGGHNGLKSIISALGTEEFPRIKIGIDSPSPCENREEAVINWVLSSFNGKDAQLISDACERAADAAAVLISQGTDHAMNMFN